MARRGHSLEEWEVALVKAMLATGKYNRQEILTYFSRPERPINLGRISEIANKKRHEKVAAATDEQMQAFLRTYQDRSKARTSFELENPLHPVNLAGRFKVSASDTMAIEVEEADWIELKQSLNWGNLAAYARTMAGFANNRGGYLVFGVHDSTKKLIGIGKDKLTGRDSAKTTQFLNQHFAPALRWEMAEFVVGDKNLGFLYTWPLDAKPTICTQDNSDDLRAGDVYYRYPGLTTRIKPAELANILRERERRIEAKWLGVVSKLEKVGIDNVAIMDTATGRIDGPGGTVLIDESLIPKLTFVREGDFSQKDGAPTLRLVGEVQPIRPGAVVDRPVVRKANITDYDVVQDFIDQAIVGTPDEYLKHLCHTQALWLPIFYYVRQAGLTNEAAAELLKGERPTYAANKKKQIGRLNGTLRVKKAAYSKAVKAAYDRLVAKEEIELKTSDDMRMMLRAIRMLKNGEIDLAYLLPQLKVCWASLGSSPDPGALGELRYTASFIDEAKFRNP